VKLGGAVKARTILAFLMNGLKPELWFWETVNMMRKFTAMLVIVFVTDAKLQIIIFMWAIVSGFLLQINLSPYASRPIDLVESAGQAAMVVTLNLVLLFFFLSDDELESGNGFALSVGVLVINSFALGAYLFVCGMFLRTKFLRWMEYRSTREEREQTAQYQVEELRALIAEVEANLSREAELLLEAEAIENRLKLLSGEEAATNPLNVDAAVANWTFPLDLGGIAESGGSEPEDAITYHVESANRFHNASTTSQSSFEGETGDPRSGDEGVPNPLLALSAQKKRKRAPARPEPAQVESGGLHLNKAVSFSPHVAVTNIPQSKRQPEQAVAKLHPWQPTDLHHLPLEVPPGGGGPATHQLALHDFRGDFGDSAQSDHDANSKTVDSLDLAAALNKLDPEDTRAIVLKNFAIESDSSEEDTNFFGQPKRSAAFTPRGQESGPRPLAPPLTLTAEVLRELQRRSTANGDSDSDSDELDELEYQKKKLDEKERLQRPGFLQTVSTWQQDWVLPLTGIPPVPEPPIVFEDDEPEGLSVAEDGTLKVKDPLEGMDLLGISDAAVRKPAVVEDWEKELDRTEGKARPEHGLRETDDDLDLVRVSEAQTRGQPNVRDQDPRTPPPAQTVPQVTPSKLQMPPSSQATDVSPAKSRTGKSRSPFLKGRSRLNPGNSVPDNLSLGDAVAPPIATVVAPRPSAQTYQPLSIPTQLFAHMLTEESTDRGVQHLEDEGVHAAGGAFRTTEDLAASGSPTGIGRQPWTSLMWSPSSPDGGLPPPTARLDPGDLMRLLRTGDDDEEDFAIPGQPGGGGPEPAQGIAVPPSPVPIPLPAILPVQPQLVPLTIEEDADLEEPTDVGPPIPFIPVALFAQQEWAVPEESTKPAFGADSMTTTQERESFAFSTTSDFVYHPPEEPETIAPGKELGSSTLVEGEKGSSDLAKDADEIPFVSVINPEAPPLAVNPPPGVIPSVVLEPLPSRTSKRPPAGPSLVSSEKQKSKKPKTGLFGSRKKTTPTGSSADLLTSPAAMASLGGLAPSPWMGISLDDEPEQGAEKHVVVLDQQTPTPARIMEPPRGEADFTVSQEDPGVTSITSEVGKKPKRSKKIRFVDSDEGTPSIEPVSAGRRAQPAPFRLDSATSLDAEVDIAMSSGTAYEPFALPPRATAAATVPPQASTTHLGVSPLFGAQSQQGAPSQPPKGLPPRPTKLAFMGKKSKKQKPTSHTSSLPAASSFQEPHQSDPGRPPSTAMGMGAEMLQLEDVEDWD
jgi:hypothetical protein